MQNRCNFTSFFNQRIFTFFLAKFKLSTVKKCKTVAFWFFWVSFRWKLLKNLDWIVQKYWKIKKFIFSVKMLCHSTKFKTNIFWSKKLSNCFVVLFGSKNLSNWIIVGLSIIVYNLQNGIRSKKTKLMSMFGRTIGMTMPLKMTFPYNWGLSWKIKEWKWIRNL